MSDLPNRQRARFCTPFGVPRGHPLPLPLGEVAERSECPKGRRTRENILPLPLGEVAERSECLKGRSTRESILPLPSGEVAERSEDGEGNQ